MALETRYCPHCKQQLTPWEAPADTWWGEILVCCNNECSYFKGSSDSIEGKRDDSRIGTRYAEDPKNNYEGFAMVAWCPR